jgi:hypothetical protein
MSSYRIDAEGGRLTKLKEYPMGQNPNWIEIVDFPWGPSPGPYSKSRPARGAWIETCR